MEASTHISLFTHQTTIDGSTIINLFSTSSLSLSLSLMATKSGTLTENLPQKFTKIEPLPSYLGLSFAVFLGLLPKSAIPYVAALQSRNRILSLKLFQAEDQLRTLRCRRKEDFKANARVVEIFASHRQAWQQEERRLLAAAEAAAAEIERMRTRIGEMEARVGELEREVRERDEMLDFVARKEEEEEEEEEGQFGDFDGGEGDGGGVGVGVRVRDGGEVEEMMAGFYAAEEKGGGGSGVRELLSSMGESKRWMERPSGWQDMQYVSLESMYNMKNFVARRESPWKVHGDSTVPSKLKLLEEELINLEKVGKGDLSKVSSLMRKQAKRYQSLTGKIDDLCRRMQASDPYEPTLSSEFPTQQQTEFLLEAVRLQHRATETRQKLSLLQADTAKSYTGDELAGRSKLSTRRSLDTIGNNFKEIQRNLEIWLARIIGDVEGILARGGASRVRDYYTSRYPFVR